MNFFGVGASSIDLVRKISKHGRTEDQGAFLFHVPSSVVLVRPGCRDYIDVGDSKEWQAGYDAMMRLVSPALRVQRSTAIFCLSDFAFTQQTSSWDLRAGFHID
jgi:hypothetical protein